MTTVFGKTGSLRTGCCTGATDQRVSRDPFGWCPNAPVLHARCRQERANSGQKHALAQHRANRHDSPLLAPTLDLLEDLGPLPDDITVHLDAGYDSDKTRTELAARGLHGRVAHRGEKAPIQAGRRWHVERTHARQSAFHRLARCYERRATIIDAFFDLADTIITVRSLIRRSWTTHRRDDRPNRRP
ncbi:transposase [Streptomyces sp. NPDC005774]|uniref:transposase n=1 Tax=Streptomyces sp. NPDC005774 TaxID=3364728 RepID=UPI003682084B